MKKNILFACLGTIILYFSSCDERVIKGEGNVGTITAKVSPFKAIQVELPLKLVVTVQKGAQPSVKFTGYSNFLLHIKTKVEDNMLFISSDMDNRMAMDSKTVVAEITIPQLTELYLSSTADADIHGTVADKTFKAEVIGKSNVTIDDIVTDDFSYTASGAASVQINGGATRIATYAIDEGCFVKAFPLETKEVSITVKGAGHCEVTALKKLSTSVAASGSVKYKGHPSILKNPQGGTINDAN